MSDDWSSKPYPGGSPVKVKGFPRPLYPPDVPPSSGYSPSSKGPDVQAYKRGISRLGRWPWQQFDDGYWTDFAHGKTPKAVATSGVAGFQYQQHIDASGWFGKSSFDNLRYAKVPSGLPHAGAPALDAMAIDLINQAFDQFKGHDAPAAAGSVRSAALKRATGQLGKTESPAGSNQQPYGAWYGMNGVPWCAIFVTWCYVLGAGDASCKPPAAFVKGSRYAYVPYVVSDARANRYGLTTVDPPSAQPGDLVCYDWNWDGVHDHIGLFEKWVGPSTFNAIEGNTSTSSNSNGGQVMRRARTLGQQGTVVVRVAS